MPKPETIAAMAERKRRSLDVCATEATHLRAALDAIDDARRKCLIELAKLDSVYFGDERSARSWVRAGLWDASEAAAKLAGEVGALVRRCEVGG